jgi:diadenosine tetraphosphate (Ap4A) HIT family hydrolase/5-methylcytosine-specific restriction endonuclease McrA
MLIELLKNKGRSSVSNIAKQFLKYDEAQIEYYQHVTKIMPGKVLTNNLEIISKDKDSYIIDSFNKLKKKEIQELINICQKKLDEYLIKRGKKIWEHRKKSSGYISGSIKWEVLKRAKGRCEACGISNDKKAIEVDHIEPRAEGGPDELHNLQALCYSCNSMKRNKDDTNFRLIKNAYNKRDLSCLFCSIKKNEIVNENELAYLTYDSYPVTEKHCLVIPKRHTQEYFDLYQPEINACNSLISEMKNKIEKNDKTVKGFNLGVNSGEVAGQTIMHVHIHLIPRRKGDVENPRGGVRGVISSKQKY